MIWVDLTGKTFGKLKVIEYLGKSKWKCQCECLNYNIVRTSDLNNGNSKGCKSCRNILKKGESGLNRLYYKYKNRSTKYQGQFDISKDVFKQLTSSNCHYCGIKPSQISKSCSHTSHYTQKNSIYLYNGLDRIDSFKNYTIDNVVPCCEMCNKAKRDIDYNDFINYIKRLTNFYAKNNDTSSSSC
jgi:hypothetical protein